MKGVVENTRTACPYLILGVRADSGRSEIEDTYRRLIMLMDENNFVSPQAWVQAQQACLAVENAYNRILENDDDGSTCCNSSNIEAVHPKLGHMLVAAGYLSLEQLNVALAKQLETQSRIGEILVNQGLISHDQLEGVLLNQSMLTIDPLDPHHLGQRLISLGLITEDMLTIAMLEQKSKDDLGQVLVEKGWLAQEILDCLSNRLVLRI